MFRCSPRTIQSPHPRRDFHLDVRCPSRLEPRIPAVRFATLEGWLAWQERLHPRPIDLGLDRVTEVVSRLGGVAPARRIVTVAGTNGKGSTVAMLASVLSAAGHRVGSYTSPHLVRYNERVRVDGAAVSDRALCEAFEVVDQARGTIALTYFEFGTLAALLVFAGARLDVALLEVGLGGRLDAVNCVDADLAIVTAIGVDHTEWLGPDRESIAREKAGIFRPLQPAICSDRRPPGTLAMHAAKLGTVLHVLGRDFDYERQGGAWRWSGLEHTFEEIPSPALGGAFQLDNAAGAVAALVALRDDLPWTIDRLHQGLRTVQLPGRFQVSGGRVQRILDVAHNPHAAGALAAALLGTPGRGRTLAVFSMLGDKDIAGVTQAMRPAVDGWYVAPLDTARAASRERLAAQIAAQSGAPLHVFDNVMDAYRGALAEATEGDRLLVFGSFHTVAEVVRGDL
jgi:dihydrofolate synthase/folylpolyglutamate synthase